MGSKSPREPRRFWEVFKGKAGVPSGALLALSAETLGGARACWDWSLYVFYG